MKKFYCHIEPEFQLYDLDSYKRSVKCIPGVDFLLLGCFVTTGVESVAGFWLIRLFLGAGVIGSTGAFL